MTPEGSIDFRKLPQWINWFPDKVPCQVDCLHTAKINDPNHFRSYEKAIEGSKRHQVAGVGFVFTADDGLMGIDLDDIYPLQHERYKHLFELAKQTYAERSPSGNGAKLWIVGKRPDWAVGHKKNFGDGTQIEWYDRNRYFTYTGKKLEGHPDVANPCPDLVEYLRQWFERKEVEVRRPSPLVDRRLGPQVAERYMRTIIREDGYPVEGDRNNRVFVVSVRIRRSFDLTDEEIFELLTRFEFGLPFTDEWTEREMKRAIASSGRYGTLPAPTLLRRREQNATSSVDVEALGRQLLAKQLPATDLISTDDDLILKSNETDTSLKISRAKELVENHPSLRKPIVDGLIREGETMNFVAAPKTGKSWSTQQLALAVANGLDWLGFNCSQGRVLLIDNELHPETLASRLGRVAGEMGVTLDQVDVLPVRGKNMSLKRLAHELHQLLESNCEYVMLIMDALYRFLPEGTSENDNAQMMQIYNLLDKIAAQLNVAIVIVHHTSKGAQSGKDVTDVGAGAGSISRAADTHLTIRPHAQGDGDVAVLDARTRSFKSPDPVTIKFDFPLWSVKLGVPPELREVKTRGESKQQKKDEEGRAEILRTIEERLPSEDKSPPFAETAIRNAAGMGATRTRRLINQLVDDGSIIKVKTEANRSGYQLPVVDDSNQIEPCLQSELNYGDHHDDVHDN